MTTQKDVEYRVRGEEPFYQVSPEASYWAEEPILQTVHMKDLIDELGGEQSIDEFWDGAPNHNSPTQPEIDELTTGKFSYFNRYADFDLVDCDKYDEHPLGEFLTHPVFIARPPAGTTLNNRVRTGRLPIIKNGAELATMFEAEKTAVWHQHVLLTLLDLPGEYKTPNGDTHTARLREVISPVRQALMQAALHTATLSALTAAWRFKWRSTPAAAALNRNIKERHVARRHRPAEYFAKHPHRKYRTLFDSDIRFDVDGNILRDIEIQRRPRSAPQRFPGTPRHPAYGSGHSTYSRAASNVLKAFLPPRWGMPSMPGGMIKDIYGSLDKLAIAIGEARFYGGVHWRKDHDFGTRVGEATATLIIKQLNRSLVNPKPSAWVRVPSRRDLETEYRGLTDPNHPRPEWNWIVDGPFPKFLADGQTIDAQNFQGGRV